MFEEKEEVVAETVTETTEEAVVTAEVAHEEGTSIITVKKLLEAGSQFGHQTKRWNPKMAPYIYTSRNGIYIIDLVKTVSLVEQAYNAIKEITEKGGKVLFVGTKKQIKDIIVESATRSGSFYVTERWLGGTLTNFKTISKRIKRLQQIENMIDDGTLDTYTKKDQLVIKKEYARLVKLFSGIKEMRKLPQAVFVIDPKIEHNAVAEARKLNIPVFGVVDTNSDPDVCDFVIPANDDAVKSVKLISAVLADAVCEAKGAPLEVAYTKDEGSEVSMNEVIKTSDRVAEQRRQARAQREAQENQRQQKHYQRKAQAEEVEAEKVEEAPVIEEVKEEKPAAKKTTRKSTKKVEEAPAEEVKEAPAAEEIKEEKPAAKKTTRKSTKKVEEAPAEEAKEEK